MSPTIPSGLRHAVAGEEAGQDWLDSIPELVARAVVRWALVLGEPFEAGMAGWTAPATTIAGLDVVLKLSYPHVEARDEGAALRAWHGAGAVELLGTDPSDWALLLRRLRPGSTLRDERLPAAQHLAVGGALLDRLAEVEVPEGDPFRDLVDVADRLADVAAVRIERLVPNAPIPIDPGLCRDAVDLLRTLPRDARRRGLLHGDLNPGNILRHDGGEDASPDWLVIDPKPAHGDLAFDPWPLVTQVGEWTDTVAPGAQLADRARLVADLTGLDAGRIASWCVARGGRVRPLGRFARLVDRLLRGRRGPRSGNCVGDSGEPAGRLSPGTSPYRRTVILPKVRDPRFVTIRRGGTLTDADHRLLALWAAECAEHVLHLFESEQPSDRRPRWAIEQVRAWTRGEITMTESRSAGGHAMAAARPLIRAARHAGFAAGQAAVVAHVAAHELGAAAYAIKAARAAVAADEAERAGQLECRWQREQLPDAIRELVLDDQRLRNAICWSVFA